MNVVLSKNELLEELLFAAVERDCRREWINGLTGWETYCLQFSPAHPHSGAP